MKNPSLSVPVSLRVVVSAAGRSRTVASSRGMATSERTRPRSTPSGRPRTAFGTMMTCDPSSTYPNSVSVSSRSSVCATCSVVQSQSTRSVPGSRLGLKAIWTREDSASRERASAREACSTERRETVASSVPGSGSIPVSPVRAARTCSFWPASPAGEPGRRVTIVASVARRADLGLSSRANIRRRRAERPPTVAALTTRLRHRRPSSSQPPRPCCTARRRHCTPPS